MTFHQQFISVMHVGYLSWKLRLLSLLLSSFFFLTYSLSLYMYTYVSEHIYLQYSQFDTLFLSLCVWCSGPLRHRNSRQKVRNKQIEREKWGKRIERQSFIQMSPFSNPPPNPHQTNQWEINFSTSAGLPASAHCGHRHEIACTSSSYGRQRHNPDGGSHSKRYFPFDWWPLPRLNTGLPCGGFKCLCMDN